MTWFRLRHWHEDEWLLERLQRPLWQLALMSASTLLLPAQHRMAVAVALMVSVALPRHRIELLATGSLVVLYQRLPSSVVSAGWTETAVAMAAVLLLIAICYQAAVHYEKRPVFVRRNAILLLHAGLFTGALALWLVLRWQGVPHAGARVVALAAPVPFLLWRLSYVVLAGRRQAARASRYIDHLMYVLPLWGGTVTPYGKGYEYLREHNAGDALALARSRLAGFKLLVLSILWSGVSHVLALVTSEAGMELPARLGGGVIAIPSLENAIASPGTFTLAERWMAVLLGLFVATVALAASGHAIIGVLRLFGFNVFRNTYKPLLATTILEFWNRYYYYFKELMVQFFFFPTFVRTASRRMEVRLALAALAAATFGNLYYHVAYDHVAFFSGASEHVLNAIGGRFIYCAVLGVGVAWSMLRERKSRARKTPAPVPHLRMARAIAGVWLFYGLLHIWNVGRHTLTINERAVFFLGLFGSA